MKASDRVRRWQPFGIPPYTPSEEGPQRAHSCKACRRAGAALRRCRDCGRHLCDHHYRANGQGEGVFVDGTGRCRRCLHARVRRFNDHFGLTRREEQDAPSGTIDSSC